MIPFWAVWLRPVLPLLVAFGTLLLGGAASLAADRAESKLLAVISFAGLGELENDIAYLGKLAENPGLATQFDAALNRATNGLGLAGLDKSRPWGAVVQTDEPQPAVWLFLPVTDPERFLAAMEPQLGRPRKLDDGLWQFALGPEASPVYLLAKGDWVFFSGRRSVLATVPSNPASLLGTLPKQYDLAVRLLPGNLSAAQLNALLTQVGQSLETWLQPADGASDLRSAVTRQAVRRTLQFLAAFAADLEQVVLGFSLDQGSARAYVDLVLTAKPTSQTARQLAELRNSKTELAGFRSREAALTGIFAGKLPEAKAAALEAILEDLKNILLREVTLGDLSEEDRIAARKAIGQLFTVLQQTVRQRQVDVGIIGLLTPERATLAAGVGLSEAERLEDVVKFLADTLRQRRPETADGIKLHAQQYRGVNFHAINLPIQASAAERQKLTALFGQRLEVVVGIGQQAAYFSIGRDALEVLKQAMDRSAAEQHKGVPPVELSLSLRPVAETVAALGHPADHGLARLIAEELKKTPGGDQISLLVTPAAFGIRYRLEVEQGVVRLAARMMSVPAEKTK
jgi:hypothetical protein